MEKEFELDEAAVKAIAEQVNVDTDAIADKVAEKMAAAAAAQADKPENKAVGAQDANDGVAVKDMTAEERTRAHLKALRNGDRSLVKEFNQHSVETLVKAGYMNVTTEADGGGFVPDADLLNEVFSLEANYGVAARLCRTVDVSSDSIKTAALTSNVAFTEVTTETGTKATTKQSFSYPTVDLREFAGIVVMTDQLLEDSAFDVRGFVSEELARAAAKKEDELLLTDSTTGLLNIAGTVITRVGVALANMSADNFIDAEYSIPTASQEGGSWILGRVVVPALAKLKGTDGQYIWRSGANADVPGTINGKAYYVSEVMPTATTGTRRRLS